MPRRLLAAFASATLLLVTVGGPVVTAGGGCHPTGSATPIGTIGETTTVGMNGCYFVPTITSVPVGAEVTFTNTSGTYHDVTGTMSEWASGTLTDGATYKHGFARPGIYPYSCSIHPGMAGVVIVGDPDAAAAAGLTKPATGGDPVAPVADPPAAVGAPSSDAAAVATDPGVPIVAVAFGLLAGVALGLAGLVGLRTLRARRGPDAPTAARDEATGPAAG